MSRQPGLIGIIDNGAVVGTITADDVIAGLTRHRRR
jgi:glycine betaine/proline transport system ATP-binding protein